MKRPPSESLLDAGKLPVAELARIAMREGVRPRPAYQAHKWFARRLAITARSLLVAAATPSSESFWRSFYKGDLWAGKTVLDPFVGGGVMLLEALRLGANVRGIDIEPVAATISSFQARLVDLPNLQPALEHLVSDVGSKMRAFYAAQDEDGRPEIMLHAFWAQKVECGACAHQFLAHPSFRLAWDDEAKRQWVICRGCGSVIAARGGAKQISCGCGVKTVVAEGTAGGGVASCPQCSHSEPLIEYARRTQHRPSFEMFAVETLPVGVEKRCHIRDRRLRRATDFDRARFSAARTELAKQLRKDPALLPDSPIPLEGRSDGRLVDYGYTDYRELFNARQQLHLALLGRAIAESAPEVREALAVAFSDHLTTNNMMCGYAGGWRRLTPLFSIRAYRHISRPVEINPWLERNGRGTFPNAVRAVTRAGNALKDPQEPTRNGAWRAVEDAEHGTCQIVCGDARRMTHIPDESVDLVLTDPPYFDYISYSELGHFFTPWLDHFGLLNVRDLGRFPRGQLASVSRTKDAEKLFARKISAAFGEVRRVCKPSGRIVFTYQNLDGRGWNAIASALATAGIVPFQSFPLYGDSGASLHKHEQSISWDSVMVCRLGPPRTKIQLGDDVRRAGELAADRWIKRLEAKDFEPTAGDRANIAHAQSVVAAFSAALQTHLYKRTA